MVGLAAHGIAGEHAEMQSSYPLDVMYDEAHTVLSDSGAGGTSRGSMGVVVPAGVVLRSFPEVVSPVIRSVVDPRVVVDNKIAHAA